MNLLKVSDRKQIALLIDPDKINDNFINFVQDAVNFGIDYFFVGGSIVNSSVENIVLKIKEITNKVPVILFPGDYSQFTNKADAILYLSLISGRNSEYLIGQHVRNSVEIKKSNIEIIPTGYILIDGGKKTSVQRVSQTIPIPADDINLTVSTAVAGELLGMQAIYLESGSGALKTVPTDMINAVKNNIDSLLIVGGGIRNTSQITQILKAGADIIVVGNSLEENPEMLREFIDITHSKDY